MSDATNISTLMSRLHEMGVELATNGTELRGKGLESLDGEFLQMLVERRQEVIEFLCQARAATRPEEQMLTAASGHGTPVLSFAQERLWFLNQLLPDCPAYNISSSWWIHGNLDIGRLQRALNWVLLQHDALRTRVRSIDGIPHPEAEEGCCIDCPVIDFLSLGPRAGRSEARKLAIREATRPFQMNSAPLARALLVRIAQDEHALIFTVHHLVFDGWSESIFVEQLAQNYAAHGNSANPDTATTAVQYSDYAVWERRRLQGERWEQLLTYWRSRLTGYTEPMALPSYTPGQSMRTYEGGRWAWSADARLVEGLRRLSGESEVTLFSVVLAGFFCLLCRLTGQRDIVIATSASTRNHPALEQLIGLFINTIPVRAEVSGHQTFREVLHGVARAHVDALAHHELPFEAMVAELYPDRGAGHTPLSQVMFNWYNSPAIPAQWSGLTWKRMSVDNGTAKTELTLSLEPEERSLSGWWEYSTDLFAEATIQSIGDAFEQLLWSAVADPGQRVSQLPLVPPQSRGPHLKNIWFPDCLLHDLVEAQASRTPGAVAVVDGDVSLTYRELIDRANAMVQRLTDLGACAEDRVAVCLNPHVDLVATLVAISKAECAYVPIDPDLPRAWQTQVIEDARPVVLVSERGLAEGLPSTSSAIVWLDQLQHIDTTSAGTFQARRAAAGPTNIAYVIHTSGTTGAPKGVMVSHRAAVNFLHSMTQTPGIRSADRLLSVSPPSSDISLLELWLPLLVGGSVCLASRSVRRDPWLLRRAMEQFQPTVMQAMPETWQMLFDTGWDPGALRILCGREQMPEALAGRLADGQAWNLYGSTETAIWSACGRVTANGSASNIGHPIANVQFYVLDDNLELCPAGMRGQLYIGGVGLARGYLESPGLTAERFVPCPFGNPGERMYATGDLVRRAPGGTFEFCGRIDHQVKVQGHCVEISTVEARLCEHPAVKQAVVASHPITDHDRYLIAYVVRDRHRQLSIEALKEFAAELLPEYMVPSQFVEVDALPLSALRNYSRTQQEAVTGHAPPSTPTEIALAEIWRDVLCCSDVRSNESFFEIGGHSLLAVQVVSRARARFRIPLSVAALFEHKTLARLGAYIDAISMSSQVENAASNPSREHGVI